MSQQVSKQTRIPRQGLLITVATWAVCLCALLWAAVAGMHLQRAIWDATEPIRFGFDIRNAYTQGQRAHKEGLLNVYDNVAAESHARPDGVQQYDLDYPPLRLTVAYLWYNWTLERFGPHGWQNTYEFHAPLLLLNRVLLAMAALSAMGLAWHFRRADRDDTTPPNGRTGAASATLAAMLVWFSPVALMVGFAWPQWDIAVPAFFLAAVLCGCRNWWLAAGMLLGIGGMYKGQVLLMLPAMVIWPLVAGKPGGLARLIVGFACAVGVIVTPFMLHSASAIVRPEVLLVLTVVLSTWVVAMGWKLTMGRVNQWFTLIPMAMILGLGYVCWQAFGMHGIGLGLALGSAIVLMAGKMKVKYALSTLAGSVVAGIVICAWAGSASWNWLHVGLLFGTEHFPVMQMGSPSNLPSILAQSFAVHSPREVVFAPGGYQVTWGQLLRGVFIAGMLASALAMGVHDRRGSRRFLLAMLAPWMFFVAFSAQVHERYVLYPALISAPLLALGCGWWALAMALQVVALMPVLQGMLGAGQAYEFLAQSMGPGFGYRLRDWVAATHPGMGWALVVLALVVFYAAMDLRRDGLAKAKAQDDEWGDE